MRSYLYLFGLALLLTTGAFTMILAQAWMLGDSWTVKFSNSEVMGTFSKMTAQISFEAEHLSDSKFDVSIDVSSAKANNADMTAELIGKEMLDKVKYPNIHFASSKVEKTSTGYSTTGILEMHGVKHEVSIPFTFKEKVFEGSFEISCKAYAMTGLDEGSDKVKIDLSIPVKPK